MDHGPTQTHALARMPEDRYIEAGGMKIRYWAVGDRGTAVVLIHGLGGSADVWMHNVRPLADRHRVYVPDLAGFGGSDRPGPAFSPSDYARFLDDFIKALGIDRPSLVGQSLGGGVALDYALRFPRNVHKLILVDSAGLGKEVSWTLRLMSVPVIGELCSRPSRRGVELFFKTAVRNSSLITEEFVDIYYRFFSRPGFQSFLLRVLRLIVTVRGARPRVLAPIMDNLGKITRPVLIVWGEKDRVLPLMHGYLAAQKLPDARFEMFENCGHLPFFEQPERFNRLVLSFLAE